MYDANELHTKLMTTFQARYPNFRSMRFLFSSEPGMGKSCALASCPVSTGKRRIIMDMEGSMDYLDAGPNGQDIYTPRRQQFAMNRVAFPTIETVGKYYQTMLAKPDEVGMFGLDNIAIFQDQLNSTMRTLAPNPEKLRELFRMFGAEAILPNNGLISKVWTTNPDGGFWVALKEIPKQIVLGCSRNGIHFIGTTEQGNVWINYGTKDAKIVGRKAKALDVWYRYVDAIIELRRDVNSTNPPKGMLYPNQPKMRLQGMNPSWRMDWQGFVDELALATQRQDSEIPEELKVKIQETVDETELN